MRTPGRSQDCGSYRDGAGYRVADIAIGVELAHWMRLVGYKEYPISQQRHRESADPRKGVPEGEERRSIVIIGREFSDEGRTRNLVERNECTHQDCDPDQVIEQGNIRPVRGIPQK